MLKSRLLTPIRVGAYIQWSLIGSGMVLFVTCLLYLCLYGYQGGCQNTGIKKGKSKELQKKPLLL